MRPTTQCNIEDSGLLSPTMIENSRMVYILTLGVVSKYRRKGIATILIDKLIDNVQSNPMLEDCRAIYLHVLTTNTSAIRFYRRLNFVCHKLLSDYYLINNCTCDGYLYVLYLNGGRPAKTLYVYCYEFFSIVRTFFGSVLSPFLALIYRRLGPDKYKGNVYTL